MAFADTIRSYLGLSADSQPDPASEPIDFLKLHLRELPPHLLAQFSTVTTPKDRTQIPLIRNRRLRYASTNPPELGFSAARTTWPMLYEGQGRRGQSEGEEERNWAERDFLQGSTKHVGKGRLANLLGGYEEEREAERFRSLRRERNEAEFVPEEESDSDDEEPAGPPEQMTEEESRAAFERLIRERFIYGLLDDGMDYGKIDWDEQLDSEDDREREERWFDEEEDE
ncbi:hypothetical protein FB45DRAFT_827566 [Roridomyces roridus]|uniref:CCD97-like C-terminal domain-containing protein n=1 Tax=Roridomyces roridus TaxID=1738132 RepID=A0AAD7C6L3_9AGAR|nr:hypothetical protein FB45DRAFT_827566 [Roridomyces roridus]